MSSMMRLLGLFTACAIITDVCLAAGVKPPINPRKPVAIGAAAAGRVNPQQQNGQAGAQGEQQNGQAGAQGEQQNGQAGAQGEQQNGQAGAQGEQQNGQAGAQGEQQNGQAGAQGEQQNGQAGALGVQQKGKAVAPGKPAIRQARILPRLRFALPRRK